MSAPSRARLTVVDRTAGTSVLRLSGPVDLAVVEALARLRLAVERCGGGLELVLVAADLAELLALTGLAPAVLQPGRQPEAREVRLGVQEVVDVDQPSP